MCLLPLARQDLIQPIPIAELKDQETLKTIGFGKYPDTAAGFTVALAGTVWLEVRRVPRSP